MRGVPIDAKDIRDDDIGWVIVSATNDRVVSTKMIDGQRVYRTQYVLEDELIRMNQQQYNESDGQRWGDGQVVARIPMNKLYQSEMIRHVKQGDREYMKWWLNHPDNIGFRTFKGTI